VLCALLRRNELAAAASPRVVEIGERKLDRFRHLHFCDVIASAAFDD
jgi:hypothetical protein